MTSAIGTQPSFTPGHIARARTRARDVPEVGVGGVTPRMLARDRRSHERSVA